MEISGSSINQPVAFFSKNTGNNINMAIDNDNRPYLSNVFSPELNEQIINKKHTKSIKRKRNSKRLNTIDTEYLPDESMENPITPQVNADNNFFIASEESHFKRNIKKAVSYFLENIPLINYFYLKRKKNNIEKTVETLKNINQNVDELLNTTIPYGEESELYSSIAKNLTDAANVLCKSKKDL